MLLEMRKVYQALRKLGVSRDKISPRASFKNDLGMDSFDMNCFVFYVESLLDVRVPDEQLEQVQTIEQACLLLSGLRAR